MTSKAGPADRYSRIAPVRTVVSVAVASRLVRIAGLVALMALGALSLRIALTNAILYVNWGDALTYAEGARRVYAGVTPYSDMQLAGPYPLDDASFGFGFVYPPSGAYLLGPFVLGEPFWYLWNAMSIVAVFGVVVLIVRREVGGLTGVGVVATVAAAATVLQPGLTDLKTGYLSPMIAAAFGAMWLWPQFSAVPAVLFGLIKLFPAAGVMWAIRKGGAWRRPVALGTVVFVLATVLHPQFLADWVTALGNAESGCPEFALWSFHCLGIPLVGYLMALVLLAASWFARRDDVSFVLLALAITVPLPDVYWGNLMVPIIAAIPLVISETRRWLYPERPAADASARGVL
jgi:hypothetical protein